jgi:putative nucleotidyltransferase with HDIG domain
MRSLSQPLVLLFGAILAVALVIALFPFFPRQLAVNEGDIAAADVRSPKDATFESEVLTEQARDEAAQAVPPVLVFDPSVATQQSGLLSNALEAIARVRSDGDLDASERRAQLLGVAELAGLSRSSIDTILQLSAERWDAASGEAGRVLSDVMTRSIAPENVEDIQSALRQDISPDLSADEAGLVADLIRPLVIPTLIVDDDATAEAQETARQNVQPVQQTVAESQLLVESGSVIDAATAELLEQAGVLAPRFQWESFLAVVIMCVLAAIVLTVYLSLYPIATLSSRRNLIIMAVIVAVPVLVGRLYLSLVLPEDSDRFLAYVLPIAMPAMLIAALLETRLAIVVALLQAALLMFVVIYLPDISLVANIEPVDVGRVLLVYGLCSLIGVVAVRRAERSNQYVLAGALVSLAVFAVLFATWLIEIEREPVDLVWMAAAASVNGVGSGLLAAGAIAVAGTLLGVTTRVQLMELSQLNAPLLRRLQDEAPGTFHHSIIVANLAERAADLIGADALLVRVGCYYHDIGKVVQPGFYIENQMGGMNPHDGMDPKTSARIIAQHVKGGLELARNQRLPEQVVDFIPQHHGTRLVPYFYRIASQQDPKVDESLFRYPGPKPQRRETAIVMLADSTEAMARALEDRSPEKIDATVEEVIAERLAEGELEDCDLTLRDLRTIAASFKQTLRGVYHPRIAYPEPTEGERRALIGRFRPGRAAVDRAGAGGRGKATLPDAPAPPTSRQST